MKLRVNKKIIILILLLALILSLLAGSIAYLKKADNRSNTFIKGTIKAEIIEDFDALNNTKENVLIKNTGNSKMYVRVSVLYLFENNDNNVISKIPVLNEDYNINFSSSLNWYLNSDGYYYYKIPVNAGEETDILIDNCTSIKEYDDKKFVVDIVVQAIQAEPKRAVEEAWGVKIVNDEIVGEV